jgi:hypothetical protein
MALDIYDADGHLDRGKVLRVMESIVTTGARMSVPEKLKLVNLLDECSEGYTMNPLDAPTMVTDYINACKRVSR